MHNLQICNHPDLLERAKWEAAEVCLCLWRVLSAAPGQWLGSPFMAERVWAGAGLFLQTTQHAACLPFCPALWFKCRTLWHSSPCLLPQDYGNPERSGKMQVLAKVLRHWREQGHK